MGKMKRSINIHDMHLTDGGAEHSDMTAVAEIYADEKAVTVVYDEPSEEMKGCRTEIKAFGSERVEITRNGAYSSVMIIEKGKRNACVYSTPIGDIRMGFTGTEITLDFNGGRLNKLSFSYEIDADGGTVSKNRIRITEI